MSHCKTKHLHTLKTCKRDFILYTVGRLGTIQMQGKRHLQVLKSHQVYCILFGLMTQFVETRVLRHSGELTGKSTLRYEVSDNTSHHHYCALVIDLMMTANRIILGRFLDWMEDPRLYSNSVILNYTERYRFTFVFSRFAFVLQH